MSPWQRVTAAAVTVSLVLAISLLVFAAQQTAANIHARMDIHTGLFERSSDPAVQMNSLYELCQIEYERASNRFYYVFVEWFEPADGPLDRTHGAQHLFYGQPHEKRLQMYHDSAINTYDDKFTVFVDCLYPPVPTLGVPDDEAARVGNAMCCALGQANRRKQEHFEQRTGHTCSCEGYDDDWSN
jgi:hypothetical protein